MSQSTVPAQLPLVADDRILRETRWLALMIIPFLVGGVFLLYLMATRWHHVSVGLLPVTAFASILGVATLLHWSRFNHGTLTFLAWAGLYFTAPFVVPAVWWRNRGADPGSGDQDDVVIPLAGRGAVAVLLGIVAAYRVMESRRGCRD